MKEITCMCEKKFEAYIAETVDLAAQPDVVNDIINGTFMNVTCPACGTVLKPEFPVTIVNDKGGWEIRFVPELVRQETMKNPPEMKGKKIMRLVIGYPELCEKMKILSGKLDDRTIEYLKYVILSKVFEKTDSEDRDIDVYFTEKKNGELLFHIQGLKDNEVGIFKIPESVYTKTLQEIDRRASEEPFSGFLTPPYVCLNRLYSWDDYDE